MSRIPLSDESLDLDDDVVEEEGTTGKEEQYAELSFETDESREYEPDEWIIDDGYDSDDDAFDDDIEPDPVTGRVK
jgi:hypothetical protein